MGADAVVCDVQTIAALDGYDAAIIGSAVYAGQWLAEARQFIERQGERLATMPVWLFSSGPIGEEPWPPGDPPGVAVLMREAGARAHTVFTGKLDSHDLGFAERLVTRVVHAPTGDFRDWETIRAWAREIGATLADQPVAETVA